MDEYFKKMIQNFPHKLKSTDMAITPAGNNLFGNGYGKPLGKSQAENFHTMVAKAPFLSNRERPYIQPKMYVLSNRLISTNIMDRKKLVRVLK